MDKLDHFIFKLTYTTLANPFQDSVIPSFWDLRDSLRVSIMLIIKLIKMSCGFYAVAKGTDLVVKYPLQ